MKHPKVFCIGFHKTGTSSLAAALEIMGYRVTGPNGTVDPDIATNAEPMVEQLAQEFDAFQDNPWPLFYQKMDALFPGSKFILTTRDSAAWISSVTRHFGTETTPMRAFIYGADKASPLGNEAYYIARMEQHNSEVRTYFSTCPDQLLELDISQGISWKPLCQYLGAKTPRAAFPHRNAAQSRETLTQMPMWQKRIRRKARGWTDQLVRLWSR
jgi:hypothetical protein